MTMGNDRGSSEAHHFPVFAAKLRPGIAGKHNP